VIVSPAQTDELLHPFLLASDERGEEDALAALFVEHVAPVTRPILTHKLQFYTRQGTRQFNHPDVEEVYQDVHTRLLRRLRALKADPVGKPINNLHSYVAALTRTTCDDYLRHKYPQRRYLKDKLRYQLTTRTEFALWETADGAWLAGLANQIGQTILELPDRDSLVTRLGALDSHAQSAQELLHAIFHAAAQPLELEYLTALVASLWGIEDRPHESLDESGSALAEQLVYPQVDPAAVLESRQLLDRLWTEICQLPRRQRIALLFNLRSQQGINVITLLPATGIASIEQIAAALEIPLPEFKQLWATLPLDDLRLAQYLCATRQQVINLRRSARDRLARRLKDWSPETR
jgi:DNA-directed RNA polymerase specialized sigma24 family protein